MVHEPQLKPLLADRERPLEQIGRTLIAAANEAGGRDNITVILFRVEEVDAPGRRDGARPTSAQTAEYDTFAGESVEPRQGVTKPSAVSGSTRPRPSTAVTGRSPCRRWRRATRERRAVQRLRPASHRSAPRRCPTRSRLRRPADASAAAARSGGALLLFLAVVLPLIVGAWLATRAVYFIGTDPADGRTVAIFRGLPYELPFGVDLYEHYYDSGVTLADVPPSRRASFTDHELRSRDDAEDLVIALEKGEVE